MHVRLFDSVGGVFLLEMANAVCLHHETPGAHRSQQLEQAEYSKLMEEIRLTS